VSWSSNRELRQESILQVGVYGRIVQVYRRKHDVKQSLCTFELTLQSLDVLRSSVPPAVGWLIICAFIAIHSTVSTGLLAVAFDFFASAFVAGTGHSTPLLHGLWLGGLVVGGVIAGRVVVAIVGAVLGVGVVVGSRLA